jgi:uncharacterized protein with PQ loop repeat
MTLHSLTLSAGWGGVLLGMLGTLAQYRRANLLGVEGVSLATWVLFVFMGCFWITYGAVSAHSWDVVLGSVILLPMQLSIVYRLKPWQSWGVTARSLGFFVASCGVAMTVNRAPQIVELIRHVDASGVSVSSWVLGVICTALWVVYYSGQHLWAPLVATFFAGLANGAIALLASWRHRQARNTLIAEQVFVA